MSPWANTATIAIQAMWIILRTLFTVFTRTITCAFPCNFLDTAMDNTLFVRDVNIEETCCWKVSQYVRISDRLQTLYACACREACILEFLKRNGTLPSIYLTNFAEIEIDAAVIRPFSSDFHHKQEMDHFESSDDACSATRLSKQCHPDESKRKAYRFMSSGRLATFLIRQGMSIKCASISKARSNALIVEIELGRERPSCPILDLLSENGRDVRHKSIRSAHHAPFTFSLWKQPSINSWRTIGHLEQSLV